MPDKNPVERAIRPLTMGGEYCLFAGSGAGGHRASAIASLIGTARLNGLNTETHLRAVLERIADDPVNRVAELLPWTLGQDSEADAARPSSRWPRTITAKHLL